MAKELARIGMAVARAAGAEATAETAADPAEEPDPAPLAEPRPRTQKPLGGTGRRLKAPPRIDAAQTYERAARMVKSCIELYVKLQDTIANAHTTAEMAGLNHPHRQAILDYLHVAVRDEDPWQFQRTSHHEMEIRVSEDLGFAPDRNPGDIIAQLCQHFHLPNNPADYPNNWRPSRAWPDD